MKLIAEYSDGTRLESEDGEALLPFMSRLFEMAHVVRSLGVPSSIKRDGVALLMSGDAIRIRFLQYKQRDHGQVPV